MCLCFFVRDKFNPNRKGTRLLCMLLYRCIPLEGNIPEHSNVILRERSTTNYENMYSAYVTLGVSILLFYY
jgi:hypothetical protein